MNKIEEARNEAFVDAVIDNLCSLVASLARIEKIPSNKEERIAFIYLKSKLPIPHLLAFLNKEDVLTDAGWDLDDKGIWFDSQDLEDGYNRAIAEVKAMFAGA